MKLENGKGLRVPTIHAEPTACCDELPLAPKPSSLQGAIRLGVAPLAPLRLEGASADAGRCLRSVVDAERRASETKAASVEIAHPPIDHHSTGERGTTRLADLRGDRTDDASTRSSQRAIWDAVKTALSSAKIDTPTISNDDDRELLAAGRTHKHDRTLVHMDLGRQYPDGATAPVGGFEPPAKGLTVPCSTVELHRTEGPHSTVCCDMSVIEIVDLTRV